MEQASAESESQMTEGCAQNADAMLEWNIKPLESLSGDFGVRVPEQEGSVYKQVFKDEMGRILSR